MAKGRTRKTSLMTYVEQIKKVENDHGRSAAFTIDTGYTSPGFDPITGRNTTIIQEPGRAKGAPAQIDWPSVYAYLVVRALNGDLSLKLSVIETAISDYLSERGFYPAESYVRERAQKILEVSKDYKAGK